MSSKKITRDTRISDAIVICPNAAEIFEQYGLGCFSCMAATAETIEEGASMHGIDVQAMLDDLNSACESE